MASKMNDKKLQEKLKLEQLGLDPAILRHAIEASEISRRRCTDNHPRTMVGNVSWGEKVAVLRDRLMPLGWNRHDIHGLPLVINSDRTVAVAVIAGDAGTGQKGLPLRTKYSKGKITKDLVDGNAIQFSFDEEELGFQFAPELVAELSTALAGCQTWYLVYRRTNKEIHFELSLPTCVGSDGRIAQWKERIFFDAIPLDEIKVNHDDRSSEDDSQKSEILVEITKKV